MTFWLSNRLLKQPASEATALYCVMRGSWDDPYAHAPHTMKQYSVEARSWDYSSHPVPCFSSRQVVAC